MGFISIKETAEKWDVTVRTVQNMCKSGLIPGAQKWERSWMIPDTAKRPIDRRTKESSGTSTPDSHITRLKNTPFISFTDLYNSPASADRVTEKLISDGSTAEADSFSMEISYFQGNIDFVYEKAQAMFEENSGLHANIGYGVVLSLCAMYKGDEKLWRKAKRYIFEAPCVSEKDKEITLFWNAAVDSEIYNGRTFPEWFKSGCFDILPADSHPLAHFFYVKYLLLYALELASQNLVMGNTERLTLLRILPNIIEPLISQAVIDRVLLEELYLRLLCAIVYHNTGNDEKAILHIDKALDLALPDKLYGILAEHMKPLDSLLDKRLASKDVSALKSVKALQKQLMDGWIRLHNLLCERRMTDKLSRREGEVAKLAVFGMSNKEIARQMGITENSVKSMITMIINKTGASDRRDLGIYI